MQLKPQDFFRDRTLYYAAQEILYEHRSGDEIYTLSSLYVISLLDFEMSHEKPSPKFVWRYSLREVETGELMTNALKFTFVELSKFNKKESELANLEDGFYFCLKHMGKLAKRPDNLDAAVFKKLFEVAEFVAMPREQRNTYIAKMTTERDIRNQIAYAREEGLKEGISVGIAEGKQEAMLEVAKAMKANGISVETVASCTGLSIETISKL